MKKGILISVIAMFFIAMVSGIVLAGRGMPYYPRRGNETLEEYEKRHRTWEIRDKASRADANEKKEFKQKQLERRARAAEKQQLLAETSEADQQQTLLERIEDLESRVTELERMIEMQQEDSMDPNTPVEKK